MPEQEDELNILTVSEESVLEAFDASTMDINVVREMLNEMLMEETD
jgi:hypothetical protein